MTRKTSRPSAQRTREKLMMAGRKAFASKGLGGASLREDILAPSGVSAGSFYHQFKDKAALLAEIIREDGARVVAATRGSLLEGGPSDPAARALSGLTYLFERAEKNPYFVKIYVREYYSESRLVQREINRHRENTMAALKAIYDRLGETRGVNLDAHSLSIMMTSQIFSLLNYHIGQSKKVREETRPAMIRSLVQLMVGGIMAVRLPDAPAASDDAASTASPATASPDA